MPNESMMTSGDPFISQDRTMESRPEADELPIVRPGPETDTGRTLDWADINEMAEPGRDPKMSMRKSAMDLEFKFPTRSQMWGFEEDTEPFIKKNNLPVQVVSEWGDSRECTVKNVPDDLVEHFQEMASKWKGEIMKTAAEDKSEIKEGTSVIHTPDNRPGKVTTMNAHVCTVEFSDGKNPHIRQVWVSDLVPASQKDAAKKPLDIKATLREMVKDAQQETLPERLAAKAEDVFVRVFLPKIPLDEVIAELSREHRGTMADMAAELKREGKTLKQAGLQPLMSNELLMATIKDKYWNDFVLRLAEFSSHRNPKNLPERVLRQTVDKLEEKAKEQSLSTEEEADLMKLLDEEEEHRGHDPQRNHVVISSAEGWTDDDTYRLKELALDHEDNRGDWSSPELEKEFRELLHRNTLGMPVDATPYDVLLHLNDMQLAVKQADVEHAGEDQPVDFNSSPWEQDEDPARTDDPDKLFEATPEVSREKIRQMFAKKTADLREKIAPEDNPEMQGMFEDEQTPDTREPNAAEDLPDQLENELGMKPKQEPTHFAVGAIKEAAADIEIPLFDESVDGFSTSEQFLGSMIAENLTEQRPRVLANRSDLINAASDEFRLGMKELKGHFSIDQVTLQRIQAQKVEENTGLMITGQVEFQLNLASHAHRRRAAVTLVMPVLAGKPTREAAYLVTAGGEKISFNKEALDELMHVRRNQLSSGKGPSRVERSFLLER